MNRRKINALIRCGLLALVAGLILRLWTHGTFAHFATGFFLGLAITLMIGGIMQQRA